MNFKNPTKNLVIADYPLGGNKRGVCKFWLETNNKGTRCHRQTTGKPKTSTYAQKMIIVEGEDNKTYILALCEYGFITIMRHDFMNAENGTIHEDHERFKALKHLLDS